MKEEEIYIKNNNLKIEGLLNPSSADKGVIICHPHSLMGGSMHNNVVEAIRDAFAAEKYTTLRFNFRGVGGSTGTYNEGIGEQEDIMVVCRYLRNNGISKIVFAGYSFGSWVGAKVIERADHYFAESIFVSPPIRYFDFPFPKLTNKINLIVCGSNDQYCDLKLLQEQIKISNTKLKIIPNADHFYLDRERELSNILRTSLNNQKN